MCEGEDDRRPRPGPPGSDRDCLLLRSVRALVEEKVEALKVAGILPGRPSKIRVRRAIILAALLAVVVLIALATWNGLDWPPPLLLLRHGAESRHRTVSAEMEIDGQDLR